MESPVHAGRASVSPCLRHCCCRRRNSCAGPCWKAEYGDYCIFFFLSPTVFSELGASSVLLGRARGACGELPAARPRAGSWALAVSPSSQPGQQQRGWCRFVSRSASSSSLWWGEEVKAGLLGRAWKRTVRAAGWGQAAVRRVPQGAKKQHPYSPSSPKQLGFREFAFSAVHFCSLCTEKQAALTFSLGFAVSLLSPSSSSPSLPSLGGAVPVCEGAPAAVGVVQFRPAWAWEIIVVF